MITEPITLLGAGLYDGKIPDVLTLSSLPTSSELDYVGADDFDRVMIEEILPKAVVEKGIDFYNLLSVDYHWINRALRILNYGPYFTTTSLFCKNCGASYGEYQVRLDAIDCIPIPPGFSKQVTVTKDQFINFDGDIVLHLPTIRDVLMAKSDNIFDDKQGRHNNEYARLVYMIDSIHGNPNMSVLEKKMYLDANLSNADYKLLKDTAYEMMDFGLRAAGHAQCPKCGKMDASFLALEDDKFFRPTLGDLRRWRDDRNSGGEKDVPGSKRKDA